MSSISMVTLDGVVAEYVAGVNAFDEDAIVATFAEDALVKDDRREFWGKDAIRSWVRKETVGDRVTVEPIEVIKHHGQTILRGRYDGEFDRTNLPDDVILTNYFTVRDERTVTLIIIATKPTTMP